MKMGTLSTLLNAYIVMDFLHNTRKHQKIWPNEHNQRNNPLTIPGGWLRRMSYLEAMEGEKCTHLMMQMDHSPPYSDSENLVLVDDAPFLHSKLNYHHITKQVIYNTWRLHYKFNAYILFVWIVVQPFIIHSPQSFVQFWILMDQMFSLNPCTRHTIEQKPEETKTKQKT